MAGSDDTAAGPSFMQATRASSLRRADTPLLSPKSPHGSSKLDDAGNNAPTTEANPHANGAAVPKAASAALLFSPKTVVASGASTVADLAGTEPAAPAAATTDANLKKHALRARQYLRFHDAHKDSGDEDAVSIRKNVEDMDPGMKKLRKLATMDGGGVDGEERWPASWDQTRHSHLKTTIRRDFSRWMKCVSLRIEAPPGPEAEAEAGPVEKPAEEDKAPPGPEVEARPSEKTAVEKTAVEKTAVEKTAVEKPAGEKSAEGEEAREKCASWASSIVTSTLGLVNLSLNDSDNNNINNDLITNTRPGRTEAAVDVSMTPAIVYNAHAGPEEGYPADGDLEWWDWYRQEHAKRRAAEKARSSPKAAGS